METVKIEGKPDLARVLDSRAIINTDEDAYEKAKRIKHNKQKESKRLDDLEVKVNRILELLENNK